MYIDELSSYSCQQQTLTEDLQDSKSGSAAALVWYAENSRNVLELKLQHAKLIHIRKGQFLSLAREAEFWESWAGLVWPFHSSSFPFYALSVVRATLCPCYHQDRPVVSSG